MKQKGVQGNFLNYDLRTIKGKYVSNKRVVRKVK